MRSTKGTAARRENGGAAGVLSALLESTQAQRRRWGQFGICGIAVSWGSDRVDTKKIESALAMVRAERQRQDSLWGDKSGNHSFEWISILGEEYGELCEAVNETYLQNAANSNRGGIEKIVKEATHVAAVAVAIIEASLTAPQRRTKRNEPLTLDELREMAQRCEGVYVAHSDGTPVFRKQTYCAAVLDLSPSFGSTKMHVHAIYGNRLTFWEDEYGKIWLAYRRKPEVCP